MKRLFLAVVLVAKVRTGPAFAQTSGLGVGIILGEPPACRLKTSSVRAWLWMARRLGPLLTAMHCTCMPTFCITALISSASILDISLYIMDQAPAWRLAITSGLACAFLSGSVSQRWVKFLRDFSNWRRHLTLRQELILIFLRGLAFGFIFELTTGRFFTKPQMHTDQHRY